MHYKNGRAAKAGDVVISLTEAKVGVLHSLNAQAQTCNARLAPTSSGDLYVTLKDCLHIEDVRAATVPDKTLG